MWLSIAALPGQEIGLPTPRRRPPAAGGRRTGPSVALSADWRVCTCCCKSVGRLGTLGKARKSCQVVQTNWHVTRCLNSSCAKIFACSSTGSIDQLRGPFQRDGSLLFATFIAITNAALHSNQNCSVKGAQLERMQGGRRKLHCVTRSCQPLAELEVA